MVVLSKALFDEHELMIGLVMLLYKLHRSRDMVVTFLTSSSDLDLPVNLATFETIDVSNVNDTIILAINEKLSGSFFFFKLLILLTNLHYARY